MENKTRHTEVTKLVLTGSEASTVDQCIGDAITAAVAKKINVDLIYQDKRFTVDYRSIVAGVYNSGNMDVLQGQA